MKYFVFVLLFISTLWGAKFDWSNDYNESLHKAQKEKKPMYVLVTSDKCPWCARFEKKVLGDKKLLEKLEKEYIIVHLTREKNFVPRKFDKKMVPHHYFVDDRGEITYNHLGYWNKKDFKSFLDED